MRNSKEPQYESVYDRQHKLFGIWDECIHFLPIRTCISYVRSMLSTLTCTAILSMTSATSTTFACISTCNL